MPGEQYDAVSAEALERFGAAFPSQRISTSVGSSSFRFDHRRVVTDRFTIDEARCTGRLHAVGDLAESVAVGRRTAGELAISSGARTVDTTRPYLRPIASTEFDLRDGAVVLVALQPAAVADYMERSGERGTFTRRTTTAPNLAAMGLVLDHAATFLDDPVTLAPHAADELHDLLCWSLLHAFEDPWAETPRFAFPSNALRRALQHIEEHVAGTITMPEVAEAARVSVRGLGLLFRRELDTTPIRWLHDLRLERTRHDLLDGRGTVAEIAARHGLRHGGRFAADYRARFGEHPAATLRGTHGPTSSTIDTLRV